MDKYSNHGYNCLIVIYSIGSKYNDFLGLMRGSLIELSMQQGIDIALVLHWAPIFYVLIKGIPVS